MQFTESAALTVVVADAAERDPAVVSVAREWLRLCAQERTWPDLPVGRVRTLDVPSVIRGVADHWGGGLMNFLLQCRDDIAERRAALGAAAASPLDSPALTAVRDVRDFAYATGDLPEALLMDNALDALQDRAPNARVTCWACQDWADDDHHCPAQPPTDPEAVR